MKKLLTPLLLTVLLACGTNKTETQEPIGPETFEAENWELILPDTKSKGVLILVGGGADRIKQEFDIEGIAEENGIALLLLKFNELILELDEKENITNNILAALDSADLKTDNVFFGGFSIGGNMALLVSDYMIRNNISVQPKGIFVVDAPVDLYGVYQYALYTSEQDVDEASLDEANFLINLFEDTFGKGDSSMINFENNSPYITQTNTTKNLQSLKNTKLRFYTEPDTTWWQENLNTPFEYTNAYRIKLLSDQLVKEFGSEKVQYIATNNRGYRANGDRHPHSWSIVDKGELVKWILEGNSSE